MTSILMALEHNSQTLGSFSKGLGKSKKDKKDKQNWDTIFETLGIKKPEFVKTGFVLADEALRKEAKRTEKSLKSVVTNSILLISYNRVHHVFSMSDSPEVILGKLLKDSNFAEWWESTALIPKVLAPLEEQLWSGNGDTYCIHVAKFTGLSNDFSTEYSALSRKERIETIVDDIGETDVFFRNLIKTVEFVARNSDKLLKIRKSKAEDNVPQVADPNTVASAADEALRESMHSLIDLINRAGERRAETQKAKKAEREEKRAQQTQEAQNSDESQDVVDQEETKPSEIENDASAKKIAGLKEKITTLTTDIDAVNMLLTGDPQNKTNLETKAKLEKKLAAAQKALAAEEAKASK